MATSPIHPVYRWVRFREGVDREWQPGRISATHGMTVVARIGSTAMYGISHFEIGKLIELERINDAN
jgi:hypothetical protein